MTTHQTMKTKTTGSKLVNLLILAAVFLVSPCRCEPESQRVDGNDSPVEQKLVAYYLRLADEKFVPEVDAEAADKYVNLVKCYNGMFTKLKREYNSKKDCDISQEPLYQLCHENRGLILDSYLVNIGKLTGASLLVAIDFYNTFTKAVERDRIDMIPLEVNLRNYSGMWVYNGVMFRYDDYCKQMIDQIDIEFGQWDYDNQQVVNFFEAVTKLPVGKALELCRMRLAL